jgi:cobalamin biosynthesis Mg chelatase CobN
LDFSLLHLADSREQFDEIFVAGRPGELWSSQYHGCLPNGPRMTYVAHINGLVPLRAGRSVVGERVGRNRGASAGIETPTAAAKGPSSATPITKPAAATAKSTTTAEAATTTKSTSHSTAEATAATSEAHASAACSREPVFTDFKHSSLPLIAMELLDGASSIVGVLKDNNTGTLGATIRSKMHIRTNDGAVTS